MIRILGLFGRITFRNFTLLHVITSVGDHRPVIQSRPKNLKTSRYRSGVGGRNFSENLPGYTA
jgi:hypothetical protein